MAQTKVSLIKNGVVTVDNLHTNHGITTDHIGEGSTRQYFTTDRVQTFLTTNNYIKTSDVANLETTTSLSLNANILSYVDEAGNTTNIDLSLYLDDSNLARIVSGALSPVTGIATFTRDDSSTFTVDFSAFLSDANDYVSSASFNTTSGVLTLTRLGGGTVTVDLDNRYLTSYTETDPTVPSHVKSITATDISNWNTSYGWGNHSGLYLLIGGKAADSELLDGLDSTEFARGRAAWQQLNFDAIKQPGLYQYDNIAAGGGTAPPDSLPYNFRTIEIGSTNRYSQIALPYGTDNMYFRRNDGGWGSWRTVIHDGNIGSQSVSYAANAGTLDNIDSTQFLRSDASDTFTGDYLGFSGLSLGIANNNSDNGYGTYFRGNNTHFVLGLTNTNTLYLNYGNSGGTVRTFGTMNHEGNTWMSTSRHIYSPAYYDDDNTGYYVDPASTSNLNALNVGGNAVITSGNIGSQSVSYATNAGTLDGIDSSNFFRTDGTYPNTDMNTTVEGYWHVASGSANLPVNYYGHRWDYDHVQNGQWVFQMYSPTGGDVDLWFRQKRDHAATAWQKVITSANIGSQSVNYASSAGNANNADNLGGLGAAGYMRDDGWNTYPGQDADTQTAMRSDFSYSNNAPHTGDLIRFGASQYSLQLSSQYSGSGQGFSFRTRNGDVGSWNPWYQILHAGNIGSYAAPIGGSWNGANMPGSRWAGYAVNGGEIVFQRDNPNNGQMSVMVDGNFYAGESGGFWSLNGSNDYNARKGFYQDSSGNLQIGTSSTENVLRTQYGYVQVGPMNTSHAHIYTDRSNFYFNKQIQLLGISQINQNDIRSKRFYDYDSTTYYVDPAEASQLSQLKIFNADLGYSAMYGTYDLSRTHNDNTRHGLVINASYYPHIDLNANANTDLNPTHGAVISMTGKLGSGYRRWGMGISQYNPDELSFGYYDNQANPHYGVGINWTYPAKMWIDTGGHLHSTGSMRSPLFYDSLNTAYYCDPGATSQLNGLTVTNTINGSISGANAVNITGYGNGNFTFYQDSGSFDAFSGWHNYFIGNHGSGASYYHTMIAFPFWGSPRYSRREGGTLRGPYEFWTSERTIISSYDVHAPIYYDVNDTNYYINPAGSGKLAGSFGINRDNETSVSLTLQGGSNGGLALKMYGGGYASTMAIETPTYGSGISFTHTGSFNANFATFVYGSTNVGYIQVRSTSTLYSTSSDYRLKENLVEITDGIERVKLLKPKRFNFIGHEETVDGFIAHEAQEVVPEAVAGEKDAVDHEGNPEYQGIDQSKLVPLLTAALQEAISKIESLEARIQVLENQ